MTKQEKITAIKDAIESIAKHKAIIENSEEAIKANQAILKELIPDNETIANVKHTAYESNSVSYAKYCDWLISKLPKNKLEEADLMKQKFTKTVMQHRFTEIEEA